MLAFRDVETAAYCPRKLYYRRREDDPDRETPADVAAVRDLAFRYPRLLEDDAALREAPVAVTPTQFRARLGSAKARLDAWADLVEPRERDAFVAGERCRGVLHKRLAGPSLSLVFAGRPPEQGVWHPQSVRLVAAARALAADASAAVDRVYAEYPAHGVVRAVDVDRRRLGAYREALRVASSIDGPPARTDDRAKCEPCDYVQQCGVRTQSLLGRLRG